MKETALVVLTLITSWHASSWNKRVRVHVRVASISFISIQFNHKIKLFFFILSLIFYVPLI